MRGKTLLIGVVGMVIGVLLSAAVVFAGSLNPSAGPGDPSSQMYTLQQVWDRINNGAAASKMSAFTEPATGPGSTMRTLDDLYTLASERSRPAKPGQTYWYWLEDVDLSGATTLHGPVSATVQTPTAVTLASVSASPAAAPAGAALPWLLAVAGAGAALALRRRRR